jgi:RND family efflux transporter MFP subunit
VTDPLSADLASLRIERNVKGRAGGKRLVTVTVGTIGIALASAVAWVEYPRIRARVYKTEVSLTEVTTLSPVQSSIQATATGYIVPQVTSKVGPHDVGRIARVFVKEGDTVRAGQVLAELDTLDQETALAAAASKVAVMQAKVETARATLAETKVKVAREAPIVEHGAESKSVLDDLVAQQASLEQEVKAAQADVVAAEADCSTLRVGLRQRTVVAPIDGVVVSKPAMPGYMATPADATPLVELVDFTSLLAEVDVPENRLSLISVGSPVELVLDAYPDRPHRGQVVEFGKRVDRSKATIVVKVKFSDDMENVLPEMSVRASFLGSPVSDEALKARPKKMIASSAVVDRGGRKVVLVVDDGVVHEVPVTLGASMGNDLELLDGPPSGAHVVSAPPPEIVDGSKVKEKGT